MNIVKRAKERANEFRGNSPQYFEDSKETEKRFLEILGENILPFQHFPLRIRLRGKVVFKYRGYGKTIWIHDTNFDIDRVEEIEEHVIDLLARYL